MIRRYLHWWTTQPLLGTILFAVVLLVVLWIVAALAGF
jgi:hypothetical protein